MKIFAAVFGAVLLAGLVLLGLQRGLDARTKQGASLEKSAEQLIRFNEIELIAIDGKPTKTQLQSLKITLTEMRRLAENSSLSPYTREKCRFQAKEIERALAKGR